MCVWGCELVIILIARFFFYEYECDIKDTWHGFLYSFAVLYIIVGISTVITVMCLKPMDSFGTWRNYFFFFR